MDESKMLKGGEFLVKECDPNDVFIAEDFNEEQLMIAQTIDDFIETEVFPLLDKIDNQEDGLMRELIGKAGEMGLTGISIPEKYSGFEQPFLTAMRANESVGAAHSFSVAFMAHTGIGTLPILYYGNEEQKQKYIPSLATGEKAACYCLTEPGAGSDANSGTTKAVLSDDQKHYILNGQKMWITNAGFADIQIVFAKIDNDRILSAFIVERDWEGIELAPEEKKMGIKGSSTRQIFYNDVKVPVENLLGKRGEGFRIALSILHIGRIKLGANVIGAGKRTITQTVNYANERKQFGKTIANFGAIKYKIAEQVIRIFAAESALYRVSKYIDDTIALMLSLGIGNGKADVEGVAKYAVECALMKVYGSETLDYIVDEAVQVYGGMGFSAETPIERSYRDSRINRIFEGTNEINRMLVIDTALKSAMKGEIALFEKAKSVFESIDDIPDVQFSNETQFFDTLNTLVLNLKKAVLLIIGVGFEKYKKQLLSKQQVMMNLSDMMMQSYIAESTLLRVQKLNNKNGAQQIYRDIADTFIYDAASRIQKSGLDAINSLIEGDLRIKITEGLMKLTQAKPVDVSETRTRIADVIIEENRYKL